jgi:hypothetical protein
MNTAQEQVTVDANALAAAAAAMENAAIDLDNANTVVANSQLNRQQKATVHASLAKVSGVLTTGETAATSAQGVAVTWVDNNPPITPPPPPPPTVTVPGAPTNLVATAGNGQVALTWAAPTSNGGGSAVVVARVTNPASIVSNLTNGTAYTFQVVALNSAGESSAATATSTPVAPVTPPSGSPVPMMSEYADYVLASGGDFEFAEMATAAAGVIPAGWVLSPESQISGPSIANDVQIVNGKGLVLTMSDSSTGAGGSLETNPKLLPSGFTVLGKFYREVGITLPALVDNQSVNQTGIWMLTESNNGEIDLVITGWGNCSGDMETGPQSQYAAHGPSYLVNGLPPTGTHKFACSWSGIATDGVQFYMDSNAEGNPVPWPSGHAPDTNSPWWLCLTQQGTAGINGAEGKMVEGAAGQLIVAYDRTFVPA